MVFKPWDAIGTQPRHILNDTPFPSKATPLPVVKVVGFNDPSTVEGSLLVLPLSLKAVLEALLKQKWPVQPTVVGHIEVWSSDIGPGFGVDEEFEEDEQLYRVKNDSDDNIERVLISNIEIYKLSEGLNVIALDNYHDEQMINYNLIAKETLKSLQNTRITEVLSLTPGSLPFGLSVGKLSNKVIESEKLPFQELVPPFYITGISAALLSQEKVINEKNLMTSVIVLQSEGVPGFERINLDSVREVSFWLCEKFALDSKKFVYEVEKLIGVGKNVNNFALYL